MTTGFCHSRNLISDDIKFTEIESTRPCISISNVSFNIVVNFETFTDAYLFIKYAHHCFESFEEEKNSLSNKLTKNTEVIFHPNNFVFYDRTILAILEGKNAIQPKEHFVTSLKIDVLTATLEEILIGVFSMTKANDNCIKEVVYYVNFMIIERLKYLLKNEVKPEVSKRLMMYVMNHDRLLNKFNITDKRFEVIFYCLVLIHKKVLFNELLSKVNQILNQMSPSFRHREEEVILIKPLRAFVDIVKTFLDDFMPFRDLICFNVSLLDTFRKFYYYFFNYFRFLFERKIIDFELDNAINMLDEVNYMIKETEKIVSEANIKFQKLSGNIPELMYLKNLTNPIINRLFDIIKIKMKTEIEKQAAHYDVESFSLVQLVTVNFSTTYTKISSASILYSMSLLKIFLIGIVESMLKIIHESEKYKNNPVVIESIILKMKASFEEQMDEQEYFVFSRFFDIFIQFLHEKRKPKIEIYFVNIMSTIGEEMKTETIERIIDIKDYTDLKVSALEMKKFYAQLHIEKTSGEAIIETRKMAKSIITSKLYIIKAISLIYCQVREVQTTKSEYVFSVIENKESWHSVVQKFDVGVIRKFSESFRKIFIQKGSLQFDQIEKSITDFERYPLVHIVFNNFCLNEYSKTVTQTRLKHIYFPCKINELRLFRIKGKRVISFQYNGEQVVVLIPSDQENAEKIFQNVEKMILAFKKTLSNSKKLVKKYLYFRIGQS